VALEVLPKQSLNVLTQNKKTWSARKQKQSLFHWPLAHRALVCCLVLRRDTESFNPPKKQYGEFCFDTCVATTLLVYYGAALRDLDQQLRISELQTVTCCISLYDLLTVQINSGVIDVGTHARHLVVDLPSIFEMVEIRCLWRNLVFVFNNISWPCLE